MSDAPRPIPSRARPRYITLAPALCVLLVTCGAGAEAPQPETKPAAVPQPETKPAAVPQSETESVEVPLFQKEPFDQITLDENNDNTVLLVLPIDLPGRRVPDPFPLRGRLEVRLLDQPDSAYELDWHAIEGVKLFDELVLERANELVRAGRLDEAYDYFQFLLTEYPNVPGLNGAIEDYLYEEAKAFQTDRQYDSALAMLRELYDRNSKRRGLDTALGLATEKLVEKYLEQDNYWTARQMLRNLAGLYPDHAVVKKWEGQFQQQAGALLAEGRQKLESGQLREAHQAGRSMMHIWPDLPGAKEFMASVQRQHPRVVVGVTLPAVNTQPGQIHDWAARRTSRLLHPTLMEFIGPGTEGGNYNCLLGQMQVEELGLRLAFQVTPDPSESADGNHGDALTGYDLARQLLALADPSDPAFRLDWAELLDRVSVQDVYRVNADLRRPHVRPEALLRTVAVSPAGPAGSGDPQQSGGPYLLHSRSEDETIYVINPEYGQAGPSQPKEVVERHYPKVTTAIEALQRGQIDVLDRINPWDLDRVRMVDGAVVEPYAVPLVHCLVPNLRKPFTARREFRRALAFGIHRQAVLDHLLRGEELPGCRLVSGPFSPGTSHDDPLDYAYDDSVEPRGYDPYLAIALAQVAFSEVSTAEKKKGVKIDAMPQFVLAHPPHEIARVACNSIQRQLRLVGIPIVLRELAPGLPAAIPDDVDLLYAELAIWEPVVDARRVFDEDGIAGGSSPYMSLALRQLDLATDWTVARARLRRIHRLAHGEISVVPLWQLTDYFAYHRSLEGVAARPVCLYQGVQSWRPTAQYAAEAR